MLRFVEVVSKVDVGRCRRSLVTKAQTLVNLKRSRGKEGESQAKSTCGLGRNVTFKEANMLPLSFTVREIETNNYQYGWFASNLCTREATGEELFTEAREANSERLA